MRIDIHAHYFPTEYLDMLERFGSRNTAMAQNLLAGNKPGDMEDRFQMMDIAGVGMQILSVTPQVPYFENEAYAVEAARLANDMYAELVQAYPDRFKAFAITPLPHVEASLTEMARGLDELGMVGVAVSTTVLGKTLADPQFEPFFAELDRRGSTLFVHPAGAGAGKFTAMFGLNWMIGAPFEDTYAVLHLILSGLTTRFPHINIVACHLGGTLPFLLDRIDHQYSPDNAPVKLQEKPGILARRLWYDTVSHGSIAALRCTRDTIGASRLILGSDYPYQLHEWYTNSVTYIQESGLPADDIQAILEGNAEQLPGMKG